MKKVLLLCMLALASIACTEDETNCCASIDVGMEIMYVNSAGENLFEIADGYMVDDITVYHKENNQWQEYYLSTNDLPNGIALVDGPDGSFLQVSPSTTLNEGNYSETMIQFSAFDEDIITTELDKTNTNIIATKVWYNDVLVWETGDGPRSFTVVK